MTPVGGLRARALLATPALVLAAACSVSVGGPDREARTDAEGGSGPAATSACAEVRAGIDDFNAGDFEGTVEHFRAAVPLAEDQASDQPSAQADDLLEAVRYYADLPPEDYLEAAQGSPEFARHKATTLGQCGGPVAPPDGGTTDPPTQT